jgi:hypothetical protein
VIGSRRSRAGNDRKIHSPSSGQPAARLPE